MLVSWLIFAAMLGQTATQPANPPPATQPATRRAAPMSVASRNSTPTPATRPAAIPLAPPVMERRVPATELRQPTTPPSGVNGQGRTAVGPGRPTQPGNQPLPPWALAPQGTPTTQPGGLARLSGDKVQVEVTQDGHLVITGPPEDVAIWQSFIKQMEDQPGAKPSFKVFRLKNAQAATIATQVAQFWNQAHQGPGGIQIKYRVNIIPEPRANLLMIATATENMPQLEDIINQLDEGTLEKTVTLEPIQLKYIKADEAANTIRELLRSIGIRRGAQQTEPATIVPDSRTSRLLISASQSDFEQIQKLVKTIDVEPTTAGGGSLKLALFPLKKAVAKTLATALKEMLQAPPATGGAQAAAMKEQIRRLQMINMREPGGKPLPELDLEKPINVWSEDGTNSLIVATVETNLAPMNEIIQLLDSVPLADQIQVRIYPLKFADADPLQANLKAIFDQGVKLPDEPGRSQITGRIPADSQGRALAYPIATTIEKRTNTLVVAGRPEQLELVDKIITQIDVKSDISKFVPRLVHLEHADVKGIADLLTKLATERQKAVEISNGPNTRGSVAEAIAVLPDVRTNSLIIAAREDNFQEVLTLIKELDDAKNTFGGQFQIVAMQNLTAADVADKVTQLWKRRSELRKTANLPADEPVIVADARTNAMIIAANPEDTDDIVKLVKQLEEQKISPMLQIRTISIKNNDAKTVGDAIQTLFDNRLKNSLGKGQTEQPGDKVSVVTDPLTKTLLVASSKSNYDEILALVKQLDVLPSLDSVLRVFEVKNADVSKVSDVITKLFQGGVFQGAGVSKDVPDSLKKVTVVADERSSTVIVSASPDNLALVEQLIKEVDKSETRVPAGAQLFKIQNVDPVRIGDMLDQLMQGIQSSLTDKTQMQFKVIADGRSRSVLVAGTRFAITQAEQLIQKLDVPPGVPAGETRVYVLKQATARQLEPVLTDLFDKGKQGGGTQAKATVVLVQAVDSSNSLIVTASPEDHLLLQHLLETLDQPSNLAQQMRIFPLEQARAEDLATTLTDLLKQQPSGGTKSATPPPIAVTAEPRTNSVIVFAPPDLMSNAQQIIHTLDTTQPSTNMGLAIFKLRNARADDLAKRLQDFFKEATTGGGGKSSGGRRTLIEFPYQNPQTGQTEKRQLIYQDISIMPDPATNSLTVLAPRGSIEMMASLIETLDKVELQTAKVQLFQLHNSDAESMKKTLDELFKASQSSSGGTSGQPQTKLVLDGGGAGAAGESNASTQLAFAVDQRTNSLIAAGSESDLRNVERLVLELDFKEIEDRIIRVVHLRNAKATDVAKTLQAYYESESKVFNQGGGDASEARTRQMEREVTVQDAGETQNTLLLSYSPRMESQIVSMIGELDLPPPQVMIQVLMAEVTLDDRLEMGMEFALQDLNFSETSFTRNGVLQGPHFDKVFGTDIGAQGQSGLGGISFTITGEDFNFLVRALQTEGRLEVLSRPAILVQDNQDANITVGERVPTIQDITVSSAGVVTPSVSYEEVGIKLDVTPIINPDGFVNIKIKPEISAIGTSSVTVASGVSLPTFTTRNADTSVTVKDGETIIIGGLITNRENNSENKVPLAGDIPLLGNLFRATVKTTTKTELLMVLTPHVIRDAEQARRISLEMRDQTGLMKNVRVNPLMNKLQVKPEEDTFGPDVPATEPSDAPADEFGPVPDEYGPPISTIHKENAHTTVTFGPSRSLAPATGVRKN